MTVDPLGVLAALATIGAGAIAGGLVGEWRARVAEGREESRDLRRLRREEEIKELDETQQDYLATMDWILAWLLGKEDVIVAPKFGPGPYPKASIYLLGSEKLIRQVVDLQHELMARPRGSGLNDLDVARMGAQRGVVASTIDAQRGRLLAGGVVTWPSAAFVQAMVTESGDQHGIPAEFRPTIQDMTPEAWRAQANREGDAAKKTSGRPRL